MKSIKQRYASILFLTAFAAQACVIIDDSIVDFDDGQDSYVCEERRFGSCTETIACGTLASKTSIVDEANDSLDELVVCGSMQEDLSREIVAIAERLGQGLIADSSSGFAYIGQGVYATDEGDASVAMAVSVFYGDDYLIGDADDTLDADALVFDSYLVDATVATDGDTVTLTYSARGPLAELMGIGWGDSSPLSVSANEWDDFVANFKDNLEALVVTSEVYVQYQGVGSDHEYRATIDAATLGQIKSEKTMLLTMDKYVGRGKGKNKNGQQNEHHLHLEKSHTKYKSDVATSYLDAQMQFFGDDDELTYVASVDRDEEGTSIDFDCAEIQRNDAQSNFDDQDNDDSGHDHDHDDDDHDHHHGDDITIIIID